LPKHHVWLARAICLLWFDRRNLSAGMMERVIVADTQNNKKTEARFKRAKTLLWNDDKITLLRELIEEKHLWLELPSYSTANSRYKLAG
jgi:hypothetical protein